MKGIDGRAQEAGPPSDAGRYLDLWASSGAVVRTRDARARGAREDGDDLSVPPGTLYRCHVMIGWPAIR